VPQNQPFLGGDNNIFEESGGAYGRRRVYIELKKAAFNAGVYKTASIMKKCNLYKKPSRLELPCLRIGFGDKRDSRKSDIKTPQRRVST